MSRQAYLEIYGQEPPAGARFGADVSWFQSTADGESLDSATLHNTWAGLAGWAEYVCIRCSYGGSGDDGSEAAHIQYADIHHYGGTLGGYHYFGPGRTPADNANNYLNRSRPLAARFVFDMLDVEEGTTAGAIEETLDRISQAKGRECLLYSGKGIMDNAGFLGRKRPLWVAHYATRSYKAWAPTTNWNLYQAPYMPNQYGDVNPTCWQFTSFTANHGHLDLNITTTPAAFGLDGAAAPAAPGAEDDMTPAQEADLRWIHDRLAALDLDAIGLLRDIYNRGEGTGKDVSAVSRTVHIDWPMADIHRAVAEDAAGNQIKTSGALQAALATGSKTGAAIGSLPNVVTAAVTAAVKALPPGQSAALSEADLVKVRAAVAEALESISIDVSATATASDVADDTARVAEPRPVQHPEGWGTSPAPET